MKHLYILLSLLICNSSFSQFINIEDMIEGRNGHTAVSVINGDNEGIAIICGGFDGFNVLESAETYNGFTNNWSPVGSMEYPRVDHTCTAFANGSMALVTGGWNGFSENYATTEIYNAADESFTDGPEMSTGRSSHVAIYLSDVNGIDYILVTGGFDGGQELASCERLNLSTMEWESAGNMTTGRSSHTLTRLDDGRVITTGGFNAAEGFQLNSCEIYDPVLNTWTEVADMIDARDHHAAIVLNDGRFLVTGGRRFNAGLNLFEGMVECEYYDVDLDEWEQGPALNDPQNYHHMVLNEGDYHLLPGGVDHTGIEVTLTYSESVELISSLDEWVNSPGIYPEGRYRYAVTTIPQGILVCGGADGDPSGELYTGVVGTDESAMARHMYFPNPAKDFLICQGYNGASLDILDSMGRTCLTTQLSESANVIDLTMIPAGLYVLIFSYDNMRSTSSLVLTK